jgi:hypothetical protein
MFGHRWLVGLWSSGDALIFAEILLLSLLGRFALGVF